MRSGTEIELWAAIREPKPLPGRNLTRWIAIALGLALLAWLASGCAGGPSAQDQADLVRVGLAIDSACETLSAHDCGAAREALTRLGVSLDDVSKARIAAGVWDTLQPVVAAALGWILAGGA